MQYCEGPEEWRYWEYVPMVMDGERAVKLQSMSAGQVMDQRENIERARRRSSPGVDRRPAVHSYVHISEDVVPHQDTRNKLRRQAQQRRGVTTLSPSDPLPNTSIQSLGVSAYSHDLFYIDPLV
ncbi:hypothetical protein BD779DRAFT_1472414 [Infundibulicybe gibba]|nr:hypothetical protein BD779DRAFT_819266 [Infundibulicybe gibba]KAF8883740.1 hypothetical protein BD779DRAFT_1472414 [Infundibulicybe gibba]